MKQSNNSLHWSQYKEQTAGYWHLKFTLILFKFLPVIFLRIIAFPIGFFYFLFSKRSRTESKRFLEKAALFVTSAETEKKCRSFFGPLRHMVAFSLALIEKLQTWSGNFSFNNIHFHDDDIDELIRRLDEGKGAFLICSHLGNSELLRGLAHYKQTGVSRWVPVNSVIDTQVTANFTRMLKELNPQSGLGIIGTNNIGPDTAIFLEEKLAAGELVVIAGDRTSIHTTGKNHLLPFLGKEAPFSFGVFYLAALLKAPVYFIFALRRGDLSINPEYDMYVHKSPLLLECTKKERVVRSSELACSFAALLEGYCIERPFQWYNFFNFWQEEV
ncbi:MAG: hypothetical protein FWG07_04630 [Treponema sp.]|nr:hypothetical protein [Treponema sp.]